MTNKLLIILFIFISCSLQGFAQKISFQVDSIKIYHLPLTLRTFFALSDYDVRNWKEKIMNEDILKIHNVTDSSDISTFTEIELMGSSNITNYNNSIDARIVIDIYLEKGLKLTIVMNDSGYYIIGNEKFKRPRNRKLNDWLRKYIPDLR